MLKTTVAVSGMVCGMCEAHVNDAIRTAFPVKKVSSSRKKGETVILSEAALDPQELRRVIQSAGYIPLSISEEPYEKRRWFFYFMPADWSILRAADRSQRSQSPQR